MLTKDKYFISLNFAAVGLWNGKSIEQISEKIKSDVFQTQVSAWYCFIAILLLLLL